MKQEKKRFPIVLYGLTIVFLVVVTAFSCLLSFMAYRSHLASTAASTSYISLLPTINRIEYALDFGKPLAHFYGMQDMLAEQCGRMEHVKNLYVIAPDKTLLHCAYPDLTSALPLTIQNGSFQQIGDVLWYPVPLDIDSTLLIEADLSYFPAMEGNYIRELLNFGLLTIAGALVLLLLLGLTGLARANIRALKRFMVVILALSQAALGLFTYRGYMDSYRDSNEKLAQMIAETVARDVERVTSLGIHPDELVDLEGYLKTYADAIPEFDRIELGVADASVGKNELSVGIDFGGETRGLELELSQTEQSRVSFQYILSAFLLMMTSILLIAEAQFLVTGRREGAAAEHSARLSARATTLMRLLFFALYAFINMGLAFSPIAASKLYHPSLGVSLSVAVGIPMTAEMLAGLVAILFANTVMNRLGMKGGFLLAIASSCLGLFGSAVAVTIPQFTAARAVMGLGYGLMSILGRTYCSHQPTEEQRTQMFANLNGGSLAGLCFGSILGGILSEHLGFGTVFLLSAIALVPTGLLVLTIPFARTSEKQSTAKGLLAILLKPASLLYLLLLIVPIYACSLFVSYVLPLASNTLLLTPTAISGMILANALLAGYLSPPLTAWCTKKLGLNKGIALYVALTALPIAAFAFSSTIPMLLMAMCALGVADSFGFPVMLEGFRRANGETGGVTGGMIAATVAGKAGQVIAPTLLLIPSPLQNVGGSCVSLAVFAAAGGVLYLLVARWNRRSGSTGMEHKAEARGTAEQF